MYDRYDRYKLTKSFKDIKDKSTQIFYIKVDQGFYQNTTEFIRIQGSLQEIFSKLLKKLTTLSSNTRHSD